MPGRAIENFELATNAAKLCRALGKAKEAKNVVKSCRGYFLLDVRVRLLAVSSCMRLAGLCFQSPAGVRKEDSERNEAHRRPYCTKRGRSGVIVLLLVLLALAVTAAEGSLNNNVKMPPPPGCSMRRQFLEQDFRSIHHRSMDDRIKYLEKLAQRRRAGAKRRRREAEEMDEEADELQETAKFLRQTLQGCAEQDQPEEGESPGEARGPPGEARGPDTTQKLKLKFNGSLRKDTIYGAESLLEHSNGGPIEIAIYRGDQIITSGELSSLVVEIVALKRNHNCNGDWTEEDFDRQIIRSGQGLNMKSVLDGDVIVQLDRGKASLSNINFRKNSHQVGVDFFILAARVSTGTNIIGTTRVEEAFMDDCPFRVLSERSKANKKRKILKLNDGVHHMNGIKKTGPYGNRLKEAGITTVKEFLMAFNEDPEKLQRKTLNIKSVNNKAWKDMVEHVMTSCTLQVVEDDLLKAAYQELPDTFDYIMNDNRPVNIHASESRFVPISGIDCADGPLPGTAGQSAPEPSRSDHHNEIANQGVGQDHAPKGDHDDDAGTLSVSDVPEVEVVNGTDGRVYMLDLHQQGKNQPPRGGSDWEDYALLASVMESDNSNPALDRSPGGNFDLSTNAIFGQDQAAGNWANAFGNDCAPGAILGDANCNAAKYRASEPAPDHKATFQAAAAPPGPQSQPSTVPGFASTRNRFEEPPVQATTFAALDQSQLNTGPSFASSSNPFSQANKSQQAYTAVNTQTIQDLRSMQMPINLQVESDAEQFVGTSEQDQYVVGEQYQLDHFEQGRKTNYGLYEYPKDYGRYEVYPEDFGCYEEHAADYGFGLWSL